MSVSKEIGRVMKEEPAREGEVKNINNREERESETMHRK